MRILITGGSGFIGKNLSTGHKFSSSILDLKDFESTLQYFREFRPEAVIHCAAKHGNFQDMEADKVGYFRDNNAIDLNVLEASRLVGVKNLVACSSVTAFPHQIDRVMTEEDFHMGEPHPSAYTYGYTKRMLDILCRAYNEQYGLNYVCAILTNIYGPHNNFNLDSATVVSNIIHKCYLAKTNNTDLELYGDGTPVRDFLYVDDLNTIFSNLLNGYSEGISPVIISSGEKISIKHLVEVIVRKMNFEGNVVWGGEKTLGQIEKVSSNNKLLEFNKDIKFTDLEEGIEKTIKWFIRQQIDNEVTSDWRL